MGLRPLGVLVGRRSELWTESVFLLFSSFTLNIFKTRIILLNLNRRVHTKHGCTIGPGTGSVQCFEANLICVISTTMIFFEVS